MSEPLSFEKLQAAVRGTAAALRCVTEYQPAGGPGDKIFPPTYEGGKYATEERRVPGEAQPVECVLLDSVQSQANRMEEALLDAHEARDIRLPVVVVDFSDAALPKPLRVTSLDAPHRIADALLRDSKLGEAPFRQSEVGRRIDNVDARNATALFELCPTALLFGMWDSTGPRGGSGAKFARVIVSEMIGLHAQTGVKTSSRIDPAQILLGAGPLYRSKDQRGVAWTLDPAEAATQKKEPLKLGKEGKPSEANHGNVTPSITPGGVTISRALQTTVLSLAGLRRLRFPLSAGATPSSDEAARTVLAALGLLAATLLRTRGCDLRSRCQLFPTTPPVWELLDRPGEQPAQWHITPELAVEAFNASVRAAVDAGLPWMKEELRLIPSPQLVELVRKSQELAATSESGEEGEE